MGALPKKKHTKYRVSGRTNHIKVKVSGLSLCAQCNSPKIAHRVCGNCGYYAGRQVISQGEPTREQV